VKGKLAMAYHYETLDELLLALNEERHIRREEVSPKVLQTHVWLGTVSPEGGYLPSEHFVARERAEVAAWLREMGARGLGRSGPASDYRRGLVFELDRVSVSELF
jgi:hypothetical protein